MILCMSWSDTLAELGGYRLGDWGSWASILGLAFTVFVSWKLIQIVRAIGKDRLSIERIQNPIEIYFHIRQTVQFLERLRSRRALAPRDDRELSRVLRGLQKSEDHLEHYFDFVSDLRQSGENAFLCAGRHFRSRGDAGRAALHYERALELNGVFGRMSKVELKECSGAPNLLSGNLRRGRDLPVGTAGRADAEGSDRDDRTGGLLPVPMPL